MDLQNQTAPVVHANHQMLPMPLEPLAANPTLQQVLTDLDQAQHEATSLGHLAQNLMLLEAQNKRQDPQVDPGGHVQVLAVLGLVLAVLNPDQQAQSLQHRVLNHVVPNPDHRVPSQGLKAQNRDHRALNQGHKVQNRGHRAHQVLNLKPKVGRGLNLAVVALRVGSPDPEVVLQDRRVQLQDRMFRTAGRIHRI